MQIIHRNFDKLESLRGIAACCVVLYHSEYFFSHTTLDGVARYFSDQSNIFVQNSYLFVDLFFIISGFVMSYAYSSRIKRNMSFGQYFILRLGRIYPLHLFMLLAYLAYTAFKIIMYMFGLGPIQTYEQNNLYTLFTNIFLIHSIGLHDFLSWNKPSWSISVEFITYIIFFISTKWLDKNDRLIFPIVAASCSFGALMYLGKDNLNTFYDFGLIRCIGSFYIGVLLFRLKNSLDQITLRIGIAEVIVTSFVILAVIFAGDGWWNQLLTLLSFFFLLYVFSRQESGLLGKLLETKPFRALGLWSYSIYMIHYLVLSLSYAFIKVVFKIEPSQISGVASIAENTIILAIIIFLSRFTYIHVEDRFRKISKKIVSSSNLSAN